MPFCIAEPEYPVKCANVLPSVDALLSLCQRPSLDGRSLVTSPKFATQQNQTPAISSSTSSQQENRANVIRPQDFTTSRIINARQSVATTMTTWTSAAANASGWETIQHYPSYKYNTKKLDCNILVPTYNKLSARRLILLPMRCLLAYDIYVSIRLDCLILVPSFNTIGQRPNVSLTQKISCKMLYNW